MNEIFGPLLIWLHTVFIEQFDGWILLGFVAQGFFTMRFVVQWLASERAKRSVVPVAFWFFSLGGGALLFIYAIQRQDPVFILGQGLGLFIYVRNLWLIANERKAANGELRLPMANELGKVDRVHLDRHPCKNEGENLGCGAGRAGDGAGRPPVRGHRGRRRFDGRYARRPGR